MEDVKPAVKAKKAPKPKKEKAKPELDEDGNPIKKKVNFSSFTSFLTILISLINREVELQLKQLEMEVEHLRNLLLKLKLNLQLKEKERNERLKVVVKRKQKTVLKKLPLRKVIKILLVFLFFSEHSIFSITDSFFL